MCTRGGARERGKEREILASLPINFICATFLFSSFMCWRRVSWRFTDGTVHGKAVTVLLLGLYMARPLLLLSLPLDVLSRYVHLSTSLVATGMYIVLRFRYGCLGTMQ